MLLQFCLIIWGRIISKLFVSDMEIIANQCEDGKKAFSEVILLVNNGEKRPLSVPVIESSCNILTQE